MLGSTAGMVGPMHDASCTDTLLIVHGIWALVSISAFAAWISACAAFVVQAILRTWEGITCTDVPKEVEEQLGAFNPA